MKRAILYAVLLVLLFAAGCVTTPKTPEQPIIIQRIIEAEGSKDELYRLANEWMAKNFKSSSDVIQYQDKSEGIMVGRGIKKTKYGFLNVDAWFTMTIEVKENKSRVLLENIYGEVYIEGIKKIMYFEETPKEEAEMRQELNEFIDEYEEYLKQKKEVW